MDITNARCYFDPDMFAPRKCPVATFRITSPTHPRFAVFGCEAHAQAIADLFTTRGDVQPIPHETKP